jgi:hypothetical protein
VHFFVHGAIGVIFVKHLNRLAQNTIIHPHTLHIAAWNEARMALVHPICHTVDGDGHLFPYPTLSRENFGKTHLLLLETDHNVLLKDSAADLLLLAPTTTISNNV